MPTATMNISLPEELKRYVQERVADGAYGNPSEFMRALIREEQRRHAGEELERELFDNFMARNPEATPEAWHALRAEYRERLSDMRHEIDKGIASSKGKAGRVFDRAYADEVIRRGRARLGASRDET